MKKPKLTRTSEETIIKVGVVGSRRRNTPEDKALVFHILKQQLDKGLNLWLVSGGCPEGADSFAEAFAEKFRVPMVIHYPDTSQLPPEPQYYDYVKMYHARNTSIAEECNILICLPHKDRKGGTEDVIKKVCKLDKPVILL